MKSKHFRIALGAALVAAASAPAHSQELRYNPSVYIAPEAGYFDPDNRFGTHATGVEGGLRVGKAINQYFDVRVGGSWARADDSTTRYQQATGGIDGLFFFSRDRIRPFLALGVGAENDRLNLPDHQNSRTSPYGSAGAGVQFAISDQFAAELEYKKVYGFQRSDVFGFRRDGNNYVTAGLTYYFDKSPSAPVRVAQAAPPPPPPPAPAAPPPPPPAPRFEKQTMSATELFAFDKSVLRQPQSKLDEIAATLKSHPELANVRITGYTDRLGSKAYNLKLSQRRAEAVKVYLVRQGVDASRLSTTGKGEEDPVVQCTEKNRAALIKCLEPNRRVEVEDITIERRVQ